MSTSATYEYEPAPGYGPPPDAYGPPPAAEGYGPPPVAAGFGPPPTGAGFGPPPVADGYGTPSMADGYGPPSTAEAYGPPPTADGYGPPPAPAYDRGPGPVSPAAPWPPEPPSPYGPSPYGPAPYGSHPAYTSPAPPPPPADGPPTGGRGEARRAAAARRRRSPSPAVPLPSTGPDTLRRLVPQALVVAVLAGGTTAFVAEDKAVELSVDGGPTRTLHTFADDVRELLAEEDLAPGPHDTVTPGGPDGALSDGDRVQLRYGRPVALTLDGRRQDVWTTAHTVDEALREIGVRSSGAYLSTAPTTPIPRSGLALDVRTERAVTFMADGRERTVRTNAATVGEALAQAGITLAGQDTTSVPAGTFPRDGQTVTVMRITDGREVREEPLPYTVVRTPDPELYTGTEVVERQGRAGVRRLTYALRTVNGVRQRPRLLADEIAREPVSRQVRVGSRPRPATVAVSGADGLDWAALAACESGGRPDAVDPSGTYGGLYQFDPGTWQALGGSGTAQQAPAAEQTFRAKKLYVQRGASPWPHCGARLHG
ncbi:ubiquitin-like domain-containing protein [Streptomyces sp. NPDC047097]|uniref:ubiquitin-like domain-containing protein n=1 Tax=Streptomyces sp. NPDC047097 TaxID=3155260 RepID=UPI0033E7A185